MHNSDDFDSHDEFDEDLPKSKTQLKQEMHELQALGKQMCPREEKWILPR